MPARPTPPTAQRADQCAHDHGDAPAETHHRRLRPDASRSTSRASRASRPSSRRSPRTSSPSTLVRLPQWADPAVAEAAGFHSIGDGRTGHEHYIHWDWIDDDVWLDPDAPESLVYEPQPDGSKKLVSAMYMLPQIVALDDVPELGWRADAVARPRRPVLHRRSRGAAGRSASRPLMARAGLRSSSIPSGR